MSKYLIASAVLVAAVGCQNDEPLQPHQAASVAAPLTTPAASEPAPVEVSAPPPAATEAPPVAAATGSIATTDGEQAGVSLKVTEFRRTSGDTVTLKFLITNSGTDNFDFGYALGDSSLTSDYGSVGGVHLIDPVGKKKYFVVRDSDNRCLCSRDLRAVQAGKQLSLWAKFPAPVDAQRVSIVVPHFIPMDEVPIS